MRKRLTCVMLLLCCTFTACGYNEVAGDIVFINCTDTPVFSVKLNWENETLVGQHADGTPLDQYMTMSFDLEDAPVTVTACGKGGTELATCEITEQPQGRWGVQMTCDTSGNYAMKVREISASETNGAYVAGTRQTWRGVVTERCMDQVRMVDSRWRFLVPSRAVIGIETGTDEGNSFWESKHYHFPDNVSLGDYVEIESAIEKSSGLLVATNIVKLDKNKE